MLVRCSQVLADARRCSQVPLASVSQVSRKCLATDSQLTRKRLSHLRKWLSYARKSLSHPRKWLSDARKSLPTQWYDTGTPKNGYEPGAQSDPPGNGALKVNFSVKIFNLFRVLPSNFKYYL